MQKINETKKYYPRIKKMLSGKGGLVCSEDNKIEHENLEYNEKIVYFQDESLDYVISTFMTNFIEFNNIKSYVEECLDKIKPGGLLILYIPHKYYLFDDKNAIIPNDILMMLKHISKHLFEILDFQTYGFDGAIGDKNLQEVEYAFQMVIKKSNNTFGRKNLNDDGALVSLDD